ncbi:MAG TPA: tripartite tricarboxylate transporter TctB family protein [Candidatus Dormibacteraeota bacterium]|nr:tripartite tricarboxylate transporter TctB family protein [Candidatus Dormibacteraeota bacterium]
MDIRRGLSDILAGSVFLVFGLAFAIGAATYEIGTPLQMGPGYFPLVLGGLLVLLGLVIVVKGLLAGEGEAIGPVPWRAMGLIAVAVVFFGATVRGLGVGPSVFVTTLLSALAGHQARIVPAVVIAVGLTALCIAIFIAALQLRLPLLGPWIGF